MTLVELGYNKFLEKHRNEQNLNSFSVGRVCLEHKERYIVKTEKNDFEAEIIGNLRFSTKNRSDFPAVGDWVAISEYENNKAIIHSIFPRKTIIERQAIGKFAEKQIIATNIDNSFIVQAVDRDFNINRIERYLSICLSSNVKSIIILSKIDLINESDLKDKIDSIKQRIKNIPIITISNHTQAGLEKLRAIIKKGLTYCLLGSSGVGKSSILNNLSAEALMKTDSISLSTKKGRHITSHRELVVLAKGGILIDNPGMREVGMTDISGGFETIFDTIVKLSNNCRYKDCTHTHESDCAVLEAIEKGEIDPDSYNNYLKIEREKAHFESSTIEKRKKDKEFGKMVKNFKNNKKQNKYGYLKNNK